MKLHIKQSGQGPVLVLLHGWGMHSAVWGDFLRSLEKQFTVVCVDLPGHGQSDVEQLWTLDEVVQALVNQLPEKFMLLGWSLGGMIALRLASQYSERVSKLIMLASSAKFVRSQDWRCAQMKTVLELFSKHLIDDPKATIKRFLLLQTQGLKKAGSVNHRLRELLAEDKLPSMLGLKSGLDILAGADLRDDLPKLTCPTLLLLGEMDQLIPCSVIEASVALNPSLKSVIIDKAVHVPFLSHHDETFNEVRKFCCE